MYSKKTSHASIPSLIFDDNMITDDTEKAEAFNNYFSSISNIHDGDDDLVEFETVPLITDIYITVQDVTDIIKSLKTNKACGHDLINHRLLKESVPVIANILCKLFNKCIQYGRFPNSWKLANISPIHKGKNPSQVNNYRPISLLSCVAKVFERCIFKYFFNFLRDNSLISINQSAYMPNDCTTNQLVSIYHDVCLALENRKDIQLIFFDISKAFDKVWHKGLIFKLRWRNANRTF